MLRETIKSMLAGSLFHTGLVDRLASGGTAVLMYHRVLPNEASRNSVATWENLRSLPGIVVTPEIFQAQMIFLKERYRLISLEDLIAIMQAGDHPASNTAVITFDDGWRDNFVYALPILRELDIPATVFLSTRFIGTNKIFWPEQLLSCISRLNVERGKTVEVLIEVMPEKLASDFADSLSVEGHPNANVLTSLIDLFKQLSQDKRDHAIERLTTDGRDGRQRVMLDWDEVRQMRDAKISFGSHGVSHELLTSLSLDILDEELKESKASIERETGQEVNSLAYPNGNFNDTVIEAAGQSGYVCALTVETGLVQDESSLLQLPRINIHQNMTTNRRGLFSTPRFACKLAQVF